MPVWSNIVVAGHSQGAGHAGVIGKHYDVRRVIMFSGMGFLNGQVPDWVASTARQERYFALHHTGDEILPFDLVKKGWQSLGMGTPADATGAYNHAQALYTSLSPALLLPLRFHNATAVNVFLPKNNGLRTAWDYLLQ